MDEAKRKALFETLQKFQQLFHADIEVANKDKHGALIGTMESLARKAGLTHTPELHLFNNCELPLAGVTPSGKKIIMSDSLMKTLGMKDRLSQVTPEVEAILGHEMAHVKEIGKLMTLKTLPIFAVPAIAVAGLYLLDRHLKHSKNEKELAKNILETDTDALCDEKKKECKVFKQPEDDHRFVKNLVKAGKYLAVAGIGTAAGFYFSGKVSNHFEFKADRISAELTGNPQAMISALKKVGSHAEGMGARQIELMEELYNHIDSKILRGTIKTLSAPLEWAYSQYMSHPSIEARVARLDQMTIGR